LLMLTPFSCWKLPFGTTRLELVMSGRSVAISLPGCGQDSDAAAAPAVSVTTPRNRTQAACTRAGSHTERRNQIPIPLSVLVATSMIA
jgi:hypothetical protein